MTPSAASNLLLAARCDKAIVRWRDILPASKEQAYAIQDATLAQLGLAGDVIGGWKVGAKGLQAEPMCAPLPTSGLLASGIALTGEPWRMRGVEVEVALRLGRDLDPHGKLLSTEELITAVDAVVPVIEVVETRLADWDGGNADAQLALLADLQSHAALVLGDASAFSPAQLDLRTLKASLTFNGQPAASTIGGNPAADVWRLLAWLALHCAQRGQPLRAGQVITTGSCTGMLFAPLGALVQAELAGIGQVALQF